MNNKQQMLTMLKEDFNRWEELLAGMSEEQISERRFDDNWSLKDVIAHLWGWQQISVARIEAALHDQEPEYPLWAERVSSDPDEDVGQTNKWIYETYKDKPWPSVYGDWRAQFLRFLELAEQVPENDLRDPEKYSWLNDYSLYDVLEGSYEHHEEHIEQLPT